jgi:hypothetical protein
MVDVDTVLGLLSERRRRYTLYYLTEQDRPVHIDEVVEAVAEMETNSNQSNIPEEKWNQIEITLQHNHLPKIDDAEFIEYNSDEMSLQLIDKPQNFDIITTVAKVLEDR